MNTSKTILLNKWKSILPEMVIFLYVLLFAYTATSKFLDYKLFVFQMRLAPLPFMIAIAPVLGWLMPLIESALAVGLLIKRYRFNALFVSVILMIFFEAYIISMLLSGQHLPCTCGGIISAMSWKAHLMFNATFIFLGIIATKQLKDKQNIQPIASAG